MDKQTDLLDPGYTPYFTKEFFSILREVKDNTPLNPVQMSVKEWYRYLLERNVVKRKIDEDGRQELIPCKIEERLPDVPWGESYRLSRLH